VTLDAVESFLRRRLSERLPGPDAQWRFAPQPALKGWEPHLMPETAREAAALLLLYPSNGGIRIPLTIRRDDLPQHAGQVSLPGGRVDPGESAEAAAVREASEEAGIDPAAIRIVGALSSLWVVVSNHVVRPFVAVTDRRPDFRLAPREVAGLVEARLDSLRDTTTVAWTEQLRLGVPVKYPYFDVDGRHVWGATAMILGEFVALFD
jgi:8-oxo-dGTP pyrophosphatase MutT (NUDIX family)